MKSNWGYVFRLNIDGSDQHYQRFTQDVFTPVSASIDMHDETPVKEEDILVRETFGLAPRETADGRYFNLARPRPS